MAFSKMLKSLVEIKLTPYCEKKIPTHLQDQIKIGFKFRGNSVTLFEERPAFRTPEAWVTTVVAQFRYDMDTSMWTLYCADRNSRWHEYDDLEPSKNLDDLIKEVEEDPICIFWG